MKKSDLKKIDMIPMKLTHLTYLSFADYGCNWAVMWSDADW